MVYHTLHLSNALSVAFSEEDPRSFTNVLRLLHEPETNLCSLTGPQRVLVKQKRNSKKFRDWVSCGRYFWCSSLAEKTQKGIPVMQARSGLCVYTIPCSSPQ